MTRIGYFGKPHGINGEINLNIEVDFDWRNCHFIFVEVDGLPVPFEVKSVRERREGTLLVSFERMSRERLDSFSGEAASVDDCYILAEREDDLSPAFYVGYKLVSPDGAVIGTIDDYDDSTPNILFSVDGHPVPAGALDIEDVDREHKLIICVLPDGLLDL